MLQVKTPSNTPRHALALATALLLLAHGPAILADAAPGQWIAVTSRDFRPNLAPLIERRQKEGFRVVVLESSDVLTAAQLTRGDGEPIRARLKELCRHFDGPSYVLLAGIGASTNSTTVAGAIVPARNVAAVAPLDAASFLRLTTPIRASITATTTDDPRATLELVNLANGTDYLVGVAPEQPFAHVQAFEPDARGPGTQLMVSENRVAVFEDLSAFAGRYARDDLGAVVEREFGVASAEVTGDALDEDLGFGSDENGHGRK